MLFRTEAQSLAGQNGSLPFLEKFTWSLKSQFGGGMADGGAHEIGVAETLEILLGGGIGKRRIEEEVENDQVQEENQDDEDDQIPISTSQSFNSNLNFNSSFKIKKPRSRLTSLHAILHSRDVDLFRQNLQVPLKVKNDWRLKLSKAEEVNFDLPREEFDRTWFQRDESFTDESERIRKFEIELIGLSPMDKGILKSYQEGRLFWQGEIKGVEERRKGKWDGDGRSKGDLEAFDRGFDRAEIDQDEEVGQEVDEIEVQEIELVEEAGGFENDEEVVGEMGS